VLKPVLDQKNKQSRRPIRIRRGDKVGGRNGFPRRPAIEGPGADAARRMSELLDNGSIEIRRTRSKAEAAVVPSLVYNLARLRTAWSAAVTGRDAFRRNWCGLAIAGRASARRNRAARRSERHNVLHRFAVAVLAPNPRRPAPRSAITKRADGPECFFSAGGIASAYRIAAMACAAADHRCAADARALLVGRRGSRWKYGVLADLRSILPMSLRCRCCLASAGVQDLLINGLAGGQNRLAPVDADTRRIFSALTNAAAVGSIVGVGLPRHVGMGKLMALALLCTMFRRGLFQPVLYGPPRK